MKLMESLLPESGALAFSDSVHFAIPVLPTLSAGGDALLPDPKQRREQKA